MRKDYSMLAQLFRLLVRESIFDSPDRQRIVVSHILREVYHNDKETANQVAYPAMQIALGVNPPIKPDNNNNRSSSSQPGNSAAAAAATAGSLSLDPHNQSLSQRNGDSVR